MLLSRRSAVHIFLIASSMLGILFGMPSVTKAIEAGPDWMNGQVTVTKVSDHEWIDGDQYTYGNIPCESVTGATWGWQTNGWFSWKVKTTQKTCATTGASFYTRGSSLLPFGGEYWQALNVEWDYYNPLTYPNPGTNGMALMTNAYRPYGNIPTELYYTHNVLETFHDFSQDGDGNIIRSPSKPFEHKLTYPDGRTFDLHNAYGLSYSANGRWLYVDVADRAQLRINTSDFSVTSFAPGQDSSYSLYTAVSNSGSTIAVYEYGRGLKLYDLTQCEAEKPDYASRDCASRDITQLVTDGIKSIVPDLSPQFTSWSVTEVKFITESQLRLLVSYFSNNEYKHMFVNLSIDPGQTTTRYLALGDSFSSGEGAGNYYEATNFWADENNYNLCHQSRVAYSELLNKYLSPDFYDSVACSGAVMQDVVYMGRNGDKGYINSRSSQSINPNEDDNFIQHIEHTNQPGYIPQLTLIQANSPTVSTISIGGNNIGFKDIIVACATQAACYSTQAERRSLASTIDQRIAELASTYKTVKENLSGTNPKLYVIGYPKLFNPDNLCGDFMSGQERQFANALVDYLNAAIKIATNQAGVRYVDASDAFYDYGTGEDHRLCGNSFPAANGLLVDAKNASDTQKLVDYLRSSYHPNALGNTLLAKRIRQLTNDFNLAMPSSTGTSSVPDNTFYRNLVGSDRTDEEDVMTSIIDGGTTAVLTYGSAIGLNLNLGSMALPVLTGHVTVQLHSDPITLGTLPVSSDGTIAGSFAIPEGTPTGMHEIHILYTDIAGQDHDLIKHIYIVASISDFDGDGIPNIQEQCAIGGTMGVDHDKDGIDDACDSDVSEKVTVTDAPIDAAFDGFVANTNHASSSRLSPASSLHNLTNAAILTTNLDTIPEVSAIANGADSGITAQRTSQKERNNKQVIKQSATWLYVFVAVIVLLGLLFVFGTYRSKKRL